jgi:NAD dependent epimerase/dehydratase
MKDIDVVFHLAALIAIPFSYHSPDAYVDTNIRGTLNVLQAARQLGIERIVHTSTSEVYGTAQFVPIDEKHPIRAQSPYAATKVAADQLALSFFRSFETPVAVLRPFNTYGPRQSTRAVIPTIITQLAKGKNTLQLGSLTPTRDFTFVKDTARAFLAVAECDDALGQELNSGSNFEISIGDLARSIAYVMGKDVSVEQDPDRLRPPDSEVERLFSSYSKLHELTGWVPLYSGKDSFLKGLKVTCDWFVQPENLAHYRRTSFVL